MTNEAIRQAAALLIEARRTGVLLENLPSSCRPQTLDDALAIQEATVSALGDAIAGWKVGGPLDGGVIRGTILQSRVFPSGAAITAATVPLLGVEAEIAFRFKQALPARDQAYTYAEVADAVTAFPAIEIVDSRFRAYASAPLIEKIADCVSNGAFFAGAEHSRWRDSDLSMLEACLSLDGAEVVRRVGGHPTRDPLLPAVDLVNALRRESGVSAGQFMTTGTYTGLNYAKPGQRVRAIFEGFGSAEVLLALSPDSPKA